MGRLCNDAALALPQITPSLGVYFPELAKNMSCPHAKRPVIGIIGNMNLLNESYPVHAGGTMNSAAVAEVSKAMPIIIPSDPAFVSVAELLDMCDGFLLTGAAMQSPCPWCVPASSVVSRSLASVGVFKRSTSPWGAPFTPRSAICRGG